MIDNSSTRQIYEPSIKRNIFSLVIFAVFVIGPFTWFAISKAEPFIYISAMCLWGAFFLTFRLILRYRPTLVVDEVGIEFHGLKKHIGATKILWKDIDAIGFVGRKGSYFVMVRYVDRNRTSILKKMLNFSYDFSFSLNLFAGREKEIFRHIEHLHGIYR